MSRCVRVNECASTFTAAVTAATGGGPHRHQPRQYTEHTFGSFVRVVLMVVLRPPRFVFVTPPGPASPALSPFTSRQSRTLRYGVRQVSQDLSYELGIPVQFFARESAENRRK